MFTVAIIGFLIFSFIGWVIDSGYRSLIEKKWINAGYFKFLFCPIYGFGGLILVFLFKYLGFTGPFFQIILASLAMILLEFSGGVFSEKVLKLKLWDYSKSKFNLGGHIDLLHSFYWIILVILFYFIIFPKALWLESLITVPEILEFPVFIVFTVLAVWLTIRKSPERFLEFKGNLANISLTEYSQIFSNIRKMNQAKTLEIKNRLEQKIKKQLENSGAYLKKLRF